MPPSIPRELVKARLQRDAAWEWYGQAVDEGQPHDITEMLYIMADCWDIICQNYYDRWQLLGGTSDISSIITAEQVIDDGAVYMQGEPRKPFAEYMATDYLVERDERAKGWREWKSRYPDTSPYHF